MNQIHSLSIRTAAAATRLAELEQKRASSDGRLNAVALRELQSAVEELRVAVEHLQEMSDALAAARVDVQGTERKYQELHQALPVACLFTDDAGGVLDANGAAGELLNISARHLRGKPLMLFMDGRDTFQSLLTMTGAGAGPVVTELSIRPRDRKPRRILVQVQHLEGHACRCWFFLEVANGAREVDGSVGARPA